MEMFKKITLNLLRIITGFLFVPHGAQKLFGVLGKPAVDLASLSGVAGVLEFFGGLAILLGLFTRPVAFVLSGMMAVAYFKAHASDAFWPILKWRRAGRALLFRLLLSVGARGRRLFVGRLAGWPAKPLGIRQNDVRALDGDS